MRCPSTHPLATRTLGGGLLGVLRLARKDPTSQGNSSRAPWLTFSACCSASAAGFSAVLAADAAPRAAGAVAALGIMVICFLALLVWRLADTRMALLDPVVIVSVTYALTAFGGILVYPSLAQFEPRSQRVPVVNPIGTGLVIMSFATAVLLGSRAWDILFRPTLARSPAGNFPRRHQLRRGVAAIGLTIGITAVAALSLGAGIKQLWYRDIYQGFGVAPTILSAGEILVLPAVFGLGIVIFGCDGSRRVFAVGLLSLLALILLATGGRGLALIPGALLLTRFVSGNKRPRIVPVIATGLLTFLMLSMVLTLRNTHSHGILPYAVFAFRHGGEFLTVGAGTVAQNLLQSFPLTDYVYNSVGRLPNSYLLVSLNPAPGAVAGWRDIAPELRRNVYFPYNTLGQLANHSMMVTTAYALATGSVLAASYRAMLSRGPYAQAAVLGAVTYFLLLSLQYNLRSATRMLYYGVMLLVLISIGRRLSRSRF